MKVAPSHERSAAVSTLLTVGLTLAFVVLLARVVQLQVAPPERLRQQAAAQSRVSKVAEIGIRGDLLDRRGRVLAATRIGERCFVDPVNFPDPPDEAIVRLAAALGLPVEQVGLKIISRMEENTRRISDEARPALAGPRFLTRFVRPPDEDGDDDLIDEVGESVPNLRPIRYVVVSGILTPEQADAARRLRIPGVHLERRSVRDYPGGAEVSRLVGKVGFENTGLLGAEALLDRKLAAEAGSTRFVRDSGGRPLWIGPGHVAPPRHGSDVRLSLDLEIQRIAREELERGVEDADAAGGRIVVLDPITGEVLAMHDLAIDRPGMVEYPWENPKTPGASAAKLARGERYITILSDDDQRRLRRGPKDQPPPKRLPGEPRVQRNRCVEDLYEPGSTFKSFVWATIVDHGLARPDEVFDTEHGKWRTSYGRPIADVTIRPKMTWAEVLVNSSNIGMVKGGERLSHGQLHDALIRFGFGRATGAGLPGEAAGLVTPMRLWSKYTQTSVSFGNEVAVTPIQMARAFSAFARPGHLAGTLPPVRMTVAEPDSTGNRAEPLLLRVLPPETAAYTARVLSIVADNMETRLADTAREDRDWKYTIYGKSGTAMIPLGEAPEGLRRPRGSLGYFPNQYNSSFVAAGPLESPSLVVVCVIDDPGPDLVRSRRHYGSLVAGPVVRRTMERTLTYLGVAPSPPRSDADMLDVPMLRRPAR